MKRIGSDNIRRLQRLEPHLNKSAPKQLITPQLHRPETALSAMARRFASMGQHAILRAQETFDLIRAMGPKGGAVMAGAIVAGSFGAPQPPKVLPEALAQHQRHDIFDPNLGKSLGLQRLDLQSGGSLRIQFVDSAAELKAAKTARQGIEQLARGFAKANPDALGLALTQIYGDRLDVATQDRWVAAAAVGSLPFPKQVRFVDSAVLRGANAAYAPDQGGTIFVNRNLVGQPERLRSAILEEVGHHLDRLLGAGDAVGDEGHLLSLALTHGRPLTTAELTAARIENDSATIIVEGKRYQVEFSTDPIRRAYEARDHFTPEDLAAAAEAELKQKVDAAVLQKYAAHGTTLEAVGAHLVGQGSNLEAARQTAEKGLLEQFAGPLTAEQLPEARTKYLGERAPALAREALAAVAVAKLVKGHVLPEGTRLESPLSPEVQRRVDQEPALKDQGIKTVGQLFTALLGDVDADLRLDVDALQLGRFIPGATQQQILRALMDSPGMNDLSSKLKALGYESPLLGTWGVDRVLTLDAPADFGLRGATEIDRIQQQFLLRTGMVFVDGNSDGKLSADDPITFVDQRGAVQNTTYGKLSPELQKLVKLNLATTQAIEAYSSRPFSEKIRFPKWDRATGRSTPEAANPAFWKVSRAEAAGAQPSWELKAGVSPSAAIDDVFGGNGGMYTTECAQGRTALRLKGLRDYFVQELGAEAGAFRFDMHFVKGTDQRKAESYWRDWEAYQNANPGKSWQDFTATNPVPALNYALEISRHHVLGEGEAVISPWGQAPNNVESAGGDTGYFHNYSVSVEGVKIGYVGENVIDLGYKDGIRRYWGHPGGVQTENHWQSELASTRIMVHDMTAYAQYFSPVLMAQDAERVTDHNVEALEAEIRQLEADKPAGFEATVQDKKNTIGFWHALGHARVAVIQHQDDAKAKDAESFFRSNPLLTDASAMAPLLATLTPAGQERAAKAFDALGDNAKKSIAATFSVAVDAMTQEQKALGGLFVGLTAGGGNRLHPHLMQEGITAARNHEYAAAAATLIANGGPMSGQAAFGAWLKTDEFKTWYRARAGADYTGETELAKMSLNQVQALVELAFPMVAGQRTVYAEVNRGTQVLSAQMAELLREGKLPQAEYRLDSRPVVPLN